MCATWIWTVRLDRDRRPPICAMAPSRALGRVVSLTAVNISQLADVFAPAGRDPGTVEKGQFPEVPDRRSDPLPGAGLASLSMCEYPHVVVTGASSSTGRAVTLCLAASGFHVYAGVRTHASGVALHQHTPPDAGLITPLLLDVTRPIQVMAAVHAVTAHTGPDGLAGLVNDAGTDEFGPPPAVSVTGELAV